ncbi:MAG: ice-binding family protein [bacterium]|nr:ice-binding family protein [bacterium]
MRGSSYFSIVAGVGVLVLFGLAGPVVVLAASSPSLGTAGTFGILSSTYTNTAGGTTITGDLGYTTGPAVAPTVSGTTHTADSTYNQAGLDQNAALSNLNSQACTSLGSGAVALNTVDIGSGAGIFTPGCYSSGGAMTITLSTTVTLNGSGTYIFRPGGALTTGANSIIALTGGATECDVFWTPTGATTLGANSTFKGTVIDAAGITIGSTVTWAGRALAFGGTVSTASDTITVPTCTATAGILRIVKTVINDSGRSATAGDFNLHVKLSGTDVAGSPTVGTATPGTSYSIAAGAYVVSEDAVDNYSLTFSGSCDSSGNVTITAGDDKTCTITNNDNAAVVAGSTGTSSGSGTGTGSANNVNILSLPRGLPRGPCKEGVGNIRS